MNRKKVYGEAIRKYGEDMQFMVAVEELAELQKEIIKHLRGISIRNNIVEEIVDVEIMIEQIKFMLGIKETETELYRKYKIDRLSERLKMV